MAKLKRNTTVDDVNILDFFYPVGTIYETMDGDFNPNTTWGGTWKKIVGRFIYGCESSQNSLVTGGEKNHTLTEDEMPKHAHQIPAFVDGDTNYGSGCYCANLTWRYQGQFYSNETWHAREYGPYYKGGGGISQQYATLHHCSYLEKNCLVVLLYLYSVILKFLKILFI